jgi:hypothetical protein
MEKVYITKYALTTGILEIEAEIMKSYWDKYPGYVKDEEGELYYLSKDAFTDEDEAIKKAEEMRKARIISLYKQIDKLDKLRFE